MIIGNIKIRPTKHYLRYHSDVEWSSVIRTILSPTETRANKKYGKDRFTYIQRTGKLIVEVHAEKDNVRRIIWVINAFKDRR